MQRVHYRSCNLCEAICGLEITTDGDSILEIKGDEKDPFSRGHLCPKAFALKDIYEDPDRLKTPVRKTNDGWEKISWKEAFDKVAEKICTLQDEYGLNTVATYQGNPNVHNLGSMTFGPTLLRQIKSRNRFSATSADQLPHMFAAYFMFGHQLLLPIPDIDRTQYMLMLGANPVVSNGSIMTAPGVRDRLNKIKNRGGKVVVIDPRRTETAKLATEHHFIRPGTDVYFLLSILYEILQNHGIRLGRVEGYINGTEHLQTIVESFAPELTAEITGIDAKTVKAIAGEFYEAESAVCYGRLGVSAQEFGGAVHWAMNMINIVTGNLDAEGGAMFPLPAVDVLKTPGMNGHYNVWQSRLKQYPEFGSELPVVALADEILTDGEGKIRSLITIAGNPVISVPNGGNMEKALKALDFMVSIDYYLNETTCHADIILPPVFNLNTAHYDLILHAFGVRNTAKYSKAVFKKESNEKFDWEIFQEIAQRIAKKRNRSSGGLKSILSKMFGPAWLIEVGLRSGPYTLSLRKLKKNPHGVDLGPLKPQLPGRLFTQDKKIHIAPEIFMNDLKRIRERMKSFIENRELFILIGRRHLRSNNSWMHNCPSLMTGKERFNMLVNPVDAEKKNIKEGQRITIKSDQFQFEVTASITEDISTGVVSIPHGWGHTHEEIQLTTASKFPGGNINQLAIGNKRDILSGNADFHVRNIDIITS